MAAGWALVVPGTCLFSLVGCGDRVLLGRLRDAAHDEPEHDDAGRVDGRDSTDARAAGDLLDAGTLPLSARLAVGALAEITGCERSCLDVAVSIDGGTPPYRVSWHDGNRASTRSLCLDPDGGDPSAEVVDSRGAHTLALFDALSVLSPCDSLTPYWTMCSSALAPLTRTCGLDDAPTYAYELSPYGDPGGAGYAQLTLRSGVSLFLSAEVYLSSSLCAPPQLILAVAPWPAPPEPVVAAIIGEDGLPGAVLIVRQSPPLLGELALDVRYCETRDAVAASE